MTRKEHKQAVRMKPCGPEGIARIRKIVADHQYAKVNETAIDATTASVVIRIYDALNDANKAKLEAMPVYKVAQVCLAMVARR